MSLSPTRLDELSARIEIGEAARTFCKSELGEVMIGLAKQEVDEATLEFSAADLTDAAKLQAIQLKTKLGLQFEAWLVELIQDGDEALQVFKQETNNN